jgi:hypothetical protein
VEEFLRWSPNVRRGEQGGRRRDDGLVEPAPPVEDSQA